MNKDEYAAMWAQLAKDGKLLTSKHDPADLANPRPSERTVIAGDLAPNLPQFFTSAEFELTHYKNPEHPATPDFFEIRPTNPAYSVPASGVDAMGTTPISQCNRLVIVSGSRQGFHVFGESSAEIQRRLAAGTLQNPSGIK
jgi:hypothetical protein